VPPSWRKRKHSVTDILTSNGYSIARMNETGPLGGTGLPGQITNSWLGAILCLFIFF
jgi:hypothetical protein